MLKSAPENSFLSVNFSPPPDLTRYLIREARDQYTGGGFGDVFKCWYRRSNGSMEVAVKALRFNYMIDSDERTVKMLHRELGIWRRLNHLNVVPFLGIAYGFGMRDSLSMVSLWMPNGSLHVLLNKHNYLLGSEHRLQLLLDIANGLRYLHSIPIVHGDLNSNNVLIDKDYNARLGDFGHASLVENIPTGLNYLRVSTIRPGALRWTAPEQVDVGSGTFTLTTKSDIYSFGCLSLQVLSGKMPWSEIQRDTAIVVELSKGRHPCRPASREIEDYHWNFIQDCWSPIEKRPTAGEIIISIQQFLNRISERQSLRDLLTSQLGQADSLKAESSLSREVTVAERLWKNGSLFFLSHLPGWFAPKKSAPSIQRHYPLPHVADAFRHYIQNDIPVRFIDTDKLKFVERDTVFDIFLSDIAQITEEDVEKRMEINMDPEAGNYLGLRKMALRDIIRDVVRYAIFSHCWMDSEPIYQDVLTPASGKQRDIKTLGFAKLVQLCKTARSQRYKLVWSDTCCIDKTKTIELSETIQAMFKWYANAHTCIVHLGTTSSLADFEHEPWFTRGWTLQDLLAPRQIKFYDKEWHPLTAQSNDKDHPALMLALSNVTGIPRDAIIADYSHGIKGRCISEVMSWASRRKTTQIEDAAYCLFGIFDVHPPILYGEGDKAFPRLVKEIVDKYQTWDIFAWAGPESKQHSVLPSSPTCYLKWDEAITWEGMTEFTLTADGLRLTSVPLIPVAFVSEAKAHDGLYSVTLRPQPRNAAVTTGMYSDVCVVCCWYRLLLLRGAADLHVCILNYKPDLWNYHRGHLQTGRSYVCFLFHLKQQNERGEVTWLKFATENVLRITCRGKPTENGAGQTPDTSDREFDLPLKTTYIREPQAQGSHLGPSWM